MAKTMMDKFLAKVGVGRKNCKHTYYAGWKRDACMKCGRVAR